MLNQQVQSEKKYIKTKKEDNENFIFFSLGKHQIQNEINEGETENVNDKVVD